MLHSIKAAVERVIDSIEMGFAALRRGLVGDVGHVVRGFESMTARLDAFANREVARNQSDYEKLNALYDRIEQRRNNISRASTVSQNIKNLTAGQ
jgi:hypothetical protein